jgi:hypothetical protein
MEFVCLLFFMGRVVAQAVSCRPPSSAARVRPQVRSCGISGGQSGTGARFLRVVELPLLIIPLNTPHLSSSSGAGIIGQIVADVPTQSHSTPRIIIIVLKFSKVGAKN